MRHFQIPVLEAATDLVVSTYSSRCVRPVTTSSNPSRADQLTFNILAVLYAWAEQLLLIAKVIVLFHVLAVHRSSSVTPLRPVASLLQYKARQSWGTVRDSSAA